jgi:hypothetical protein
MNSSICLTVLSLGLAVVVGSSASASPPLSGAVVSPSSDCTLRFANGPVFKARKLDERRVEVAWQKNRQTLKTEVRVLCGSASMSQSLADAGFSRSGDLWLLSVGGAGTTEASAIATSTWIGYAGNLFQESVCRAVVGQSRKTAATFTLDYCVSEVEYRSSKNEFESIQQHIEFELTQ